MLNTTAQATSNTAPSPTGTRAKPYPRSVTAAPPITEVRATAPPGGCRQPSSDISAMEPATASEAANSGSGTNFAQLTPTRADRMLPPITALGWVSGLAGTANNSTAEAPSGATSNGSARASPPMNSRASTPVTAMPSRLPSPARQTSPNLTGVPRRSAASILLIMGGAYATGAPPAGAPEV